MFMVAVLVSFSAIAGEPPKKCVVSCRKDDNGVLICMYDERVECGKRQKECVDSDTVDCKPIFVNLGPWNPMMDQYYGAK